ncbi:MAG: cbb3-type cytochrome c oxidase N-terminal domain-containing protein [Deferribacterales bacterium]
MQEEFDNLEEFSREDTENALPLGWLILFIGLIVFGIYYVYAYTPAFTGWTQEKQLEQSMQDMPK